VKRHLIAGAGQRELPFSTTLPLACVLAAADVTELLAVMLIKPTVRVERMGVSVAVGTNVGVPVSVGVAVSVGVW